MKKSALSCISGGNDLTSMSLSSSRHSARIFALASAVFGGGTKL